MRLRGSLFTVITLIFVCAIDFLFCQGAGQTSGSPKERSLNEQLDEIKKSNDSKFREDYRLGSGDILEISVFNIKELNKTVDVTANGKITLPFIDEVQVEGLTAQELKKKLESLLESRVMKNPQVTVRIKEHHSRPIYILGAVQKPGTYQLVRKINLIDALALAGGFHEKAGDKIYLRKEAKAGSQSGPKAIEIDLKELLVDANSTLNYPVEPGDVISIPLKVDKIYYVLGDVGKPGVYEFKEKDAVVRLSQAIAAAGGHLRTAALKETVLVRQEKDGRKDYIALNLEQILKGKAEDVLIKPNDLIFVPNSATKNVKQAIVNGLASIVTAGIIVIK